MPMLAFTLKKAMIIPKECFMAEGVSREQVVEFFQGGSMESVVARIADGTGDGFPGPDFRQNRVAEQAKEMFSDTFGEVLTESALNAHGYNFDSRADREEFIEAIKAGAALAIIAFGDAEGNADFFEAFKSAPEKS